MLTGSRLFETGQGSDLTITCKGTIFKVHSAIIASQSKFFSAACWGNFKARLQFREQRDKADMKIQQEAQSHCIDLPDDDPINVEAMLQYLYSLDYDVETRSDIIVTLSDGSNSTLDPNRLRELSSLQLVCNASLYSMGEKYGINGLKSIASEKFAVVLKQREWIMPWNSPNISIGALGTAIRRIYDTTPESDKGLRDQVLGYAKLHLKGLLTQEDFKVLLAEIPEFSYQLLVQQAESMPSEEPLVKKKRNW